MENFYLMFWELVVFAAICCGFNFYWFFKRRQAALTGMEGYKSYLFLIGLCFTNSVLFFTMAGVASNYSELSQNIRIPTALVAIFYTYSFFGAAINIVRLPHPGKVKDDFSVETKQFSRSFGVWQITLAGIFLEAGIILFGYLAA